MAIDDQPEKGQSEVKKELKWGEEMGADQLDKSIVKITSNWKRHRYIEIHAFLWAIELN